MKDDKLQVKSALANKLKENQMSYQLNMFGVAVDGSIPRCTSLYNVASKQPANPVNQVQERVQSDLSHGKLR